MPTREEVAEAVERTDGICTTWRDGLCGLTEQEWADFQLIRSVALAPLTDAEIEAGAKVVLESQPGLIRYKWDEADIWTRRAWKDVFMKVIGDWLNDRGLAPAKGE